MAITPGTRLGPYEIGALLGVGGMGEVYRARDTILNRTVAIKVLPDAFATDPDRMARFEREAKTLASLNHPHIAAIYTVEKSAGMHALVMELVEGDDLSERIARGAIPVEEALPIAKQIADALEAAHEQGIVHRDLKPANIKVRADGTVKVLDFGLAKAMEPGGRPHDVSQAPTITTPAMTQAGMVLGTAAYMAPEQARGRPADKRSDVWAFGAVLYELLSGQRAFKGSDVAETLAAVLRQDIDWTALPPSTPPAARRLLVRCLDRDPRRRLRDIGEARIVLEDPAALAVTDANSVAVAAFAPQPLWRRPIAAVLGTVAVAVAVLATAATVYLRPQQAPPAVTRFPLMLGAGEVFPGGTRTQFVAISPDGAHVAYVVNGAGLYVRSMAKLDARLIATGGTGRFVANPVFSPDSGSLAFWSNTDQTIKTVSVNGGAAVTICSADQPFGMSWDMGAITFAAGKKGILRVAETGGTPVTIVSVTDVEQAHGPQVLPGGDTVLFTLAAGDAADRWDNAQIVTQSLRSGERKTLVERASDARYLPTGHLVYARQGIVFAVPIDVRRLEVKGGPVPIIEGVSRGQQAATGATQFSVSTTGSLVYVPGPVSTVVAQLDLGLIDRQGTVQALALPPRAYQHPRASPNGKQIAVGTDDGKEAIVWIYDLGSTTSVRQLTLGGKSRFPIWSADGERVAYQSDREGDFGIFWQRADGSGGAERLTTAEPGTSHVAQSWLPGGDRFLFTVASGSNMSLRASSSRDHKTTQIADKSSTPMNASFSADGRWIAYAATEGSETGVYVQPFPPTGDRYLIAKPSFNAVWSRQGLELMHVQSGGQWAVQTITTEPSFGVSPAVGMSRGGAIGIGQWRNFDTTPDGRILSVVAAGQAASTAATRPQIQVVLNWTEELKRLVPSR